uniref:HTH_Tnp_Tc3_2 domain-containing protein n=1 Tax=Caenorhabditis japonica TaxID=281687 RepID=A0A8R1I3W1_CAEJA
MTKIKLKVYLTPNQQFAIARGREQGRTLRQLAEQFNFYRSTIRTFLKRWRAQNRQPAETSYAHREATLGPVPSEVLDQVSPRGSPVASGRTIRQRLNDAGLFGRRLVKKPYICDRNRAARVAWARAQLDSKSVGMSFVE